MFLLSIFAGINKWRSAGDTASPWTNDRRSGDRKSVEKENAAGLSFEADFHRMLLSERKRSERSNKTMLLLMMRRDFSIGTKEDTWLLRQGVECVTKSVRDTDLAGWLETDSVFGVLFTELGDTEITAATNAIRAKVIACLQKSFDTNQVTKFLVSFHQFPNGWDRKAYGEDRPSTLALHPSSFDRRGEMTAVENVAQ